MRSIKISLWTLIICLCIFTLILYHLYHFSFYKTNDYAIVQLSSSTKRIDTPMKHVPLNEIYKDIPDHNQDFSIELEETKQGSPIHYTVIYIIQLRKRNKVYK